MSRIIPPLVSDSPPPPHSEEDEDDEFDDFRVSNDISYGCENISSTPSPDQSPSKIHKESPYDEEEPEFKFMPVTPESVQSTEENLHLDSLNINGSIRQKIYEESSQDLFRNNSSNLSHKNDVLHEDNIPSQFIIDSKNVKHGNNERNCDNSPNIHENSQVFHIDENLVRENSSSNSFSTSETTEDFDSTSKICNSWSEEYPSHANLEISLSNDRKYCNHDKFVIENEEKITVSSYVNKEGQCSENKNDENPIHSNQNSSDIDLVRRKTLEDIQKHEILDTKNSNDTICLDPSLNHHEDTIARYSSDSSINKRDEKEDDFGSSTSQHVEVDDVSSGSEQIFKNVVDNLSTEGFSFDLNPAENIEKMTSFSNDCSEQGSDGNGDSFGDFSAFPTANQDGFGDFSAFPTANQDQIQSNHDPFSSKSSNDKEEDNNFARLASFPVIQQSEPSDEDSTFTSFSTDSIQRPVDTHITNDDFGEFTSTTVQQSPSNQSELDKTESSKPFLLLDEKQAFEKTKEIIQNIFEQSEEVFNEFQYFELGKGDFIFTQLQDVTETPALGYNWSKSSSQKVLLKALNIDSRNILHGHSWNAAVPRFAANLGVQPLEPFKMEPLTPTPLEPTVSIPQSSQPEVPSAQFDWSSSGLVNPLDYSPGDSVKPVPTPTSSTDTDVYEEFTSFQSSDPSQLPDGWPRVPLRETHISGVPQAHIDVDVCLQPTIVTPEMPRKVISVEDDVVFSETSTEDKGYEITQVENVEFDDFQMVFPPVSKLKTNADVEDENVENNNIGAQEIEYRDVSIIGLEVNNIPESIAPIDHEEEDDDFTEFHSSAPLPQSQIPPQTHSAPTLAPILEPLQPTPVYKTNSSTQINWPDPGITQDELKRFEEAFPLPSLSSQKKDDKPEVEATSTTRPKKEVEQSFRSDIPILDSAPRINHSKKGGIEEELKKVVPKQNSSDDEWSDFVSAQKPSPVHKTKLTDRTRTSSPDLPLSVLNLGSIQPTKQPIPVITPQGLVQTKLSTNMSPIVQQKVVNKHPYDLPPLQPSIISNQYATQAYNFGTIPTPRHIVQNGQDEDEWGEFVSSTLPPQYQNSSTTVGHHGWNNYVPNIRMMPDQGLYNQPSASGRTVSKNVLVKKNNLSGLALPDLDFLAPEGRSGIPRKK